MELVVIVLILSFILFLSSNVPVAVSIAMSSFLAVAAIGIVDPINAVDPAITIAGRMANGINSYALLAIPFFILSGTLMGKGGLARRLMDFANALLGKLPGGLAYVNTLTCMFFGAISGSAAAAVSSVGGFMIPEMVNRKYSREFSVAITTTAATTGLMIPPSNIMIVYAVSAGTVSVTALFLAGVVPGIITGLFIMLAAALMSLKNYYKGRKLLLSYLVLASIILFAVSIVMMAVFLSITAAFLVLILTLGLFFFLYLLKVKEGKSQLLGLIKLAITITLLISVVLIWSFQPMVAKILLIFSMFAIPVIDMILVVGSDSAQRKVNRKKSTGYTFFEAFWTLLLIVIVIGGMLAGFFTATEAAAIAVLYSFILAVLVYKEVKWNELGGILLSTGKTTAMVMLLIGASQSMSWLLSTIQLPQAISGAMLTLSSNPIIVLLLINVLLLFVGTFMDMTPAVLIFTPIFLPVVMELGVNPVHFGILMIANLCIGLCTPPVGTCLFIGCGVGKTTIAKVTRSMIPFFIAMFISLLLITWIPALSTALPRMLGKL